MLYLISQLDLFEMKYDLCNIRGDYDTIEIFAVCVTSYCTKKKKVDAATFRLKFLVSRCDISACFVILE